MKKALLVILLTLVIVSLGVSSFAAMKYPYRDITNVVVWAAGGGTDVCNRVVTGEMAKILGVNINVINKTGGVGGSVGMSYVYSQKHDGYTLAGISESCVTAGVQGGFDKKFNVWYPFIVGGSPDVISVTPNSEYKTLEDLIKAAKANPGSIRAGASASGSIHHLNLLALEDGTGAKFNFIPYTGSAQSQTAAMTGEVTVVVTSLAEQQQLIRGGKLRVLATLTPDTLELEGVGAIPSSFSSYPTLKKYLPIMQAIGFAIPADAPRDVKNKLTDAFKKAMATDTVKNWAKENFYVISGKVGADASNEFEKLESLFSWTLWDLGAAKINPANLKIAKPKK